MGKKLKIRDLTLRDGQQSLFATRMSQSSINELLPFYQKAGFYAMEVWGGAVPDSVMRYLDENPWTRLKTISDKMEGISLLTALSRGRNLFGYVPYPTSVIEGFYEKAIKNGLNIMRIFDALNDLDNVKESIAIINKLGGIPDGAVCYTVDQKPAAEDEKKGGFFSRLFKHEAKPQPVFTDEYFISKAKGYEQLGAKIITLKDMAGLVNPVRAAHLIKQLKAAVNVPIDFHTHCTPGYGLASVVMAMMNGVDIIDTNIWYFGEGSAAPTIELIYVFAKKLGIELDVDMQAVGEIRKRLKDIRKGLAQFDLHKDQFPRDFDPVNDTLPAEVDALFGEAIACGKREDEEGMLNACHKIEEYFGFPKPNLIVKNAEVPGGMYSNMVAQLRQLHQEDVLEAAMKLIPKVRRDAGMVPLVTPTSQIVGSQAVSLALDRKNGRADYSMPSMQFRALVRGEYGKTPVPIDPAFRQQITGSPDEKPYDVSEYKKPENPELPEFGGVKLAQTDEDYLLMELLPSVATGFLKKRRKEEWEAKQAAQQPKQAAKAAKKAEQPITGPTADTPLMGGTITEVAVKPGDKVKRGDKLVMFEAMKMNNWVTADGDYTVKRVLVNVGDVVGAEQPLVEFE